MIARLAAGLARVLLVTAAILAIAALLLVVLAWRLLSYPYRRATPTTRRKLEAGLNVVGALAAFAATLRGERGAVDLAVGDEVVGGVPLGDQVERVGVGVG